MKPIAVTALPGSRTDFFWLKSSFEMYASSPKRGFGFDLNFGGVFTSVPAAVSAIAPRDLVASTDGGVVTAGVAAVSGAAGVPLKSTAPALTAVAPASGVVTRPLTKRLDLFGLDPDYKMVHKRFWGVFDQNDLLVPWQTLGGTFTSAPAAIAWAGDRVDVFGVGLDHAMYVKTAKGETWTPNWTRLGGAFTSGAALVSRGPKLLDLFARGADFTLRGNHTDGTIWFGFQNHGGELASAPVAVSWGVDRIDVFAIFKDGALWHRWWDGQIWNEWESLGGNYDGEPAAATSTPGRLDVLVVGADDRALHHHVFSRDTWRNPVKLFIPHSSFIVGESPSVISTAPNRLELFVPMANKEVRYGKWDGRAWEFESAGTSFRAPQRYRISVDFVHVTRTRSLDADTDFGMVSVAAGNRPAKIETQSMGKIGGFTTSKSAQTNILRIEPVTIDLAEPMSFSYLIVNNGHASEEKIMAALANAGNSLSLSGSSSMQEDIARGVVKFVTVQLLGDLSVPVVGSILKEAESYLLDKLLNVAFAKCDGVVAVELRAMMGRDLYKMTNNGKDPVRITTRHVGTDSATGCGFNSLYKVDWSITPL
jgi:hypothetical protein